MTAILAALVLVLDPGHDPELPGAVSAHGRQEFVLNQEIVAELERALASDTRLSVLRTRKDGERLGLRQRAARARAHRAALLLSVHHDSVKERDQQRWLDGAEWRLHSDAGRGFSLHVRGDDPAAVKAAVAIGEALVAAGFVPTRYHLQDFAALDLAHGVYDRRRLALLNASTMPAVILECGFVSSREEEESLLQPEIRRRLVEAVAAGLRVAMKEVER